MTLRFEQILADGVAQSSYLIGDDAAGTTAVLDSWPDVEVYLELAQRYGFAITHVFETHIHADFMSGTRELVARLGGIPKLCVSAEGGAEYGFDQVPVRDGDSFVFGSARMIARHTPGHTPEHVSFLLHEDATEEPWGVLTGDSFFVASVGRPDLLGDEETGELTEALFRTVQDFYMKLPDGVIIYPCHSAGSACGPNIGDRMSSAIGYERAHNKHAQIPDPDTFRRAMTENAPPVPAHYPWLKEVNATEPEVLGNLLRVPGMAPAAFAEEAGLTYLHYPVAGDKLSEDLVDDFRQKVETLPAPVLVHCASGKRSGAMVMMHLGADQGMTGDEAIEKAGAMGLECGPELEHFVRGYVDRHNER